jgi:hypothetical protein
MLTTYEIALYGFVVAVLLPLAAFALVTGARPPENSWFSKYYRAEKYLHACGNLFLLTVCANAISRLAFHFGLIDAALKDRIAPFIGVPFAALLIAFLVLWVRAYLKVRRTTAA